MTDDDPVHMRNFVSNVMEVDRLLEIHAMATSPGPGRKHAVEILNKSGIVLLVACWEAFVEDLASNALRLLLEKGNDHSVFSDEVLERIGSKHQGKNAWLLAGDGWKSVCVNHLKDVLAKTTGNLNTPKAQQVDELFEKVLGLKEISKRWSWKGRTVAASREDLDALVTLRGSIAHRVKATRNVRKKDVTDARDFISRLAVKSHNAVTSHLATRLGTNVWQGYWFSETR